MKSIFNTISYHVLHFNVLSQNVKHLAKLTLWSGAQATTIKKYISLCTFHHKANYKGKITKSADRKKKIQKVPFPSDNESSESALQ